MYVHILVHVLVNHNTCMSLGIKCGSQLHTKGRG